MGEDLLKQRLIEYGMDLGLRNIRITTADPLELWDFQVDIRRKIDPESSNLWTNIGHDPKEIMPEARSIVVGVWPYIPYRPSFPKGIGGYSAYYEEGPKGRQAIEELRDFLEKTGYKAIAHPNLPIKEIAHRAGVGYFGKNGLIHTKEQGSWVAIHCILTNAPLSPDKAMDKISDCGDCTLCIKACPTRAIGKEGQVTPSKCIRYHMLSSDFIPVEIRGKIGNRFLGCDICQGVCPFNKEGLTKALLPSHDKMELFDIDYILSQWRAGMKSRTDEMGELIGKNYARVQKILSMAVILAGNSKDQSYIPALVELLEHPHPPIRGHSVWAIGKIGPKDYREILVRALQKEKDARVSEEIRRALDG